ncbi:MAG: aminotransferase class V-fold PLP-dependent enzyme [Anaerolineaceae bacterium]|nr:aminotransferase class V-fold PLP-dependent enzyme [Anaerolineaceae bacterium]
MNKKIRNDFPVTENCIYLDTANVSPQPIPVRQAGIDFLMRRSLGKAGKVPIWLIKMEEVKRKLAQLLNVNPQTLAFTNNTSAGTNIVSQMLGLKRGDNVIWEDSDFPANKLIWLKQAERLGFQNRVVHNLCAEVHLEDIEAKIDENTRLISVSTVNHASGFRHDIKALCEMAHVHNVLVHVDAIQAVGSFEVDVLDEDPDFLTCGLYKWLLGPEGLAFFYVKESLLDQYEPNQFGWMQVEGFEGNALGEGEVFYRSARKFQTSTLHFQGLYELEAALDYIQMIGIQ